MVYYVSFGDETDVDHVFFKDVDRGHNVSNILYLLPLRFLCRF